MNGSRPFTAVKGSRTQPQFEQEDKLIEEVKIFSDSDFGSQNLFEETFKLTARVSSFMSQCWRTNANNKQRHYNRKKIVFLYVFNENGALLRQTSVETAAEWKRFLKNKITKQIHNLLRTTKTKKLLPWQDLLMKTPYVHVTTIMGESPCLSFLIEIWTKNVLKILKLQSTNCHISLVITLLSYCNKGNIFLSKHGS